MVIVQIFWKNNRNTNVSDFRWTVVSVTQALWYWLKKNNASCDSSVQTCWTVNQEVVGSNHTQANKRQDGNSDGAAFMSTGIKFHTESAAKRKAREPIAVLIRGTVRVPDPD